MGTPVAKCGGLGPGHVTQGPRQVLKGTIMACTKPSRSKDISAAWQVAANLSPERTPLLPEQPLASQSPHLLLKLPEHSPWCPPGIHAALAGEETWLVKRPFFRLWAMVSVGRGSTASAHEWGQGSVRDGAPAPEEAAVTFNVRLGPV